MRMFRNLLVDLNNLAFTTRHSSGLKTITNHTKKEKYVKEMIFKNCLTSIIFHANKFNSNGLVIVTDSKNVWRKDIYPEYKSSSSPSDDVYYDDTIAAIDMLLEFFSEYTAAYCLNTPRCEGDDIIGFWCINSEMVENTILSSDTDYIQLITEQTNLYSPAQNKFRESYDPQYDLFLKCVRGDKNDTIPSAFPRVQEKRLKAAWGDDLEMLNLLNETRPDGRTVGDVICFNASLIDLNEQPFEIKQKIMDTITTYTPSKFDEIKCMRFLNQNNLKAFNRIAENATVLRKSPVFRCSK
ncbi:DNA polymerase I [Alishewanella phage vB_AspM_Slickus01]|nr:DNA polymerase I [Alishewanella phage vB_AspM_Slickus01]